MEKGENPIPKIGFITETNNGLATRRPNGTLKWIPKDCPLSPWEWINEDLTITHSPLEMSVPVITGTRFRTLSGGVMRRFQNWRDNHGGQRRFEEDWSTWDNDHKYDLVDFGMKLVTDKSHFMKIGQDGVHSITAQNGAVCKYTWLNSSVLSAPRPAGFEPFAKFDDDPMAKYWLLGC